MQIMFLLAAVALAGCSKNNEGTVTPPVPEAPVAVQLSAGLHTLPAPKAPVVSGTSFTAAVAGWESASTVNYATAAAWSTTAQITASASAAAITLAQSQTYSQQSGVSTYMKAWYPAGTLDANGQVTFGGTADGTTDVLLAGEVVGSATNSGVKTLTFNHPLTQLKFKVDADASFGTATTITGISVHDAQLPSGIDLASDAVAYAGAANLTVPGIAAGQAITATAAAAGDPIMMKPFTGNQITLTVTTSDATYDNVKATIDDDANFIPGKAYTITLHFSGAELQAQASVTDWVDSGTGQGDVQ